jgi:hypothetical protein
LRFPIRLLDITSVDIPGATTIDTHITSVRGPRGSRNGRWVEIEGVDHTLDHQPECRHYYLVATRTGTYRIPCVREARWGWHFGACCDITGTTFLPDGTWA